MRLDHSAAEFLPDDTGSLSALRAAADGCQGCDLYRAATQTVFGEGPPDARVVMIGEQPGDVEDRAGEPFVGPAGRLLDRAITEAGLRRDEIYVTNAVKHFKFVPPERGKRRIHKTPNRGEIVACRPWLVQELALLRPSVLVVLGASAAKALLGAKFKVTESRGQLLPWPDAADRPEDFPAEPARLVATIHPSAVLRSDDREAMFRGFVEDLRVAAEAR
ncbi:MAG: UdgX family uracil-DNA binding protein [Hamadaea sp.]|nr:UdgX family uracil-DNA binding protein [Hamadaea sp.]NUT06336.1 UdgX family uracil-DNA binding protein [Hamadaea sp.]